MLTKTMTGQMNSLTILVANKTPVSIYLINGVRLQGVISDFDEATLCLGNKTRQLIYKHAISTIVEDSPTDVMRRDMKSIPYSTGTHRY